MNIEATAELIMSAMQSDAFDEKACEQILRDAHNADLADERQRNFDAEKELRDKARARIEELRSDLFAALAALKELQDERSKDKEMS